MMTKFTLTGLFLLSSAAYISGADQKKTTYDVHCFYENKNKHFSHKLNTEIDFSDDQIIDCAKKCFNELKGEFIDDLKMTVIREWTQAALKQMPENQAITWQKEQTCQGNCEIHLLIQYRPLRVSCTEDNFEGKTHNYTVTLYPREIGNEVRIMEGIEQGRHSHLQSYMLTKKLSNNYADIDQRIGNCDVEVAGFESDSSRRVPVASITIDMLRNKTHALRAVTRLKTDL